MKRIIALAFLAATAAAAQGPAPTAKPGFSKPTASGQRPCLTPAEAKGLATFVLPGLVDNLTQRCRGTLTRAAFLRQPAAETLALRLRRDAASSWPVARGAIEKLNGERLPGLFGDRFLMNMAERPRRTSSCAISTRPIAGRSTTWSKASPHFPRQASRARSRPSSRSAPTRRTTRPLCASAPPPPRFHADER